MYLVLHANTIDDLQRQVSSYLAHGWGLAGGITTQPYYGSSPVSPNGGNSIKPGSMHPYTIWYLQAIYQPQSKDLSCL